MDAMIETKDQYFRISAQLAWTQSPIHQSICVVDLESFNTVGDLLNCIEKYDKNYRFVLVSGKGLLSEIMDKHISISKKATMQELSLIMRKRNITSFKRVSSYLESIKMLTMLSHKEQNTIYGALVQKNLISAANFIGVTPHMYYQRMISVAKKLNLKSSSHVQYFINSEFSVEDVRRIICQN